MRIIHSMSEQLPLQSNVPEFSVSELAFSLKRMLEDTYGRVRVRGELSRVSIPKSGHLYTGLKDENSVLDAVCWKGVLSKLSIKPEEGLEVICIGKITTYPMSSKYQLVIESMELAGEGALLKMLEERKKKLAAEGLFAAERKKPLPFLPQKIGVVTSPTGAVIRDILHRLNDRFPRHVMVWPVKVQGDGAANEITNAINGFNALPPAQRPDIIIVARGGGSLEDLMAFNEENVVRAAAASTIPLISAVGHETDTTLIDYASDLRAPTPTGAAEQAVPVRINLIAQVAEDEKRLMNGMIRMLSERRHRLDALSAKLGDPARLLELKVQHLDRLGDRLEHAFQTFISKKKEKFSTRLDDVFSHYVMKKSNILMSRSSRLRIPQNLIHQKSKDLTHRYEQLERTGTRFLEHKERNLSRLDEKLEILSFENVLKRGYVVVRDEDGTTVTDHQALSNGKRIDLQFKENKHVGAVVEKTKDKKPVESTKTKEQGSLF